MIRKHIRWTGAILAAVVVLMVAPTAIVAQSGGEGFLFNQPRVTVSIRGGYSVPRAGSDIYDHTISQLTIDRDDFASGYFGGEIAARLTNRLDLALGAGYSISSTQSEFRDWVDIDDLPIEQTTDLSMTALTLSAKYYLTNRGRSVGRFAWIPTKFNAFVGAGIGITNFDFLQRGDWVDFETFNIFNTKYRSNGVTASTHAFTGLDISLTKNLFLTGEGRYSWAKGDLDLYHFEGFDKMDLSGLQLSVGISVRF
jgi:opacity protein-like surface antigen